MKRVAQQFPRIFNYANIPGTEKRAFPIRRPRFHPFFRSSISRDRWKKLVLFLSRDPSNIGKMAATLVATALQRPVRRLVEFSSISRLSPSPPGVKYRFRYFHRHFFHLDFPFFPLSLRVFRLSIRFAPSISVALYSSFKRRREKGGKILPEKVFAAFSLRYFRRGGLLFRDCLGVARVSLFYPANSFALDPFKSSPPSP